MLPCTSKTLPSDPHGCSLHKAPACQARDKTSSPLLLLQRYWHCTHVQGAHRHH